MGLRYLPNHTLSWSRTSLSSSASFRLSCTMFEGETDCLLFHPDPGHCLSSETFGTFRRLMRVDFSFDTGKSTVRGRPQVILHRLMYTSKGPISALTFLGTTYIILNDVKVATELLEKRTTNTSDRYNPAFSSMCVLPDLKMSWLLLTFGLS